MAFQPLFIRGWKQLSAYEGRVGFQNQISSFISTMPLARKLNQLENQLIEFFHLLEVEDDTIGENDRNEFLKSIEKKK